MSNSEFKHALALLEISRLKQVVAEKYGADTSLMGHVEMLESIVKKRATDEGCSHEQYQ